MKILVGKHHAMRLLVDTKNRYGLGPLDFIVVGPRHIGGMIDGRWNMIEREVTPRRKKNPRKESR